MLLGRLFSRPERLFSSGLYYIMNNFSDRQNKLYDFISVWIIAVNSVCLRIKRKKKTLTLTKAPQIYLLIEIPANIKVTAGVTLQE